MADIAGAQECNNEDEEGRSDIESDREEQAAIPQLKSFKEAIASIEQVQHFLECHGMSVEVNALSTTVDRIAAVAINAMVQTTLHDYFTSRLFFFSVISHVKIVILTHIVEIRRLKVKYIVNLWIKDTSIKGTKCCVPLCPLKRGSTVYNIFVSMGSPFGPTWAPRNAQRANVGPAG